MNIKLNALNKLNIDYNNKTKNIENKANRAINGEDERKLLEVCKDFESIFVNMMIKQMRKTVVDSGFTEKSNAREIFESMYDEEIVKNISKNGQGIGLAKVMFDNLKRNIKK